MSYYHLANYDAALPFLEKFSEVKPEHSSIHGYIGVCYENTGDLDKAYEEYLKQININNSNEIGVHALKRISVLKQLIEKDYQVEKQDKKKKRSKEVFMNEKKKLKLLIFYVWIVSIIFIPCIYCYAETISSEKLVSDAIDKTLLDINNPYIKVIKQGSWISGTNFRPITSIDPSDYDSRLFIDLQELSKEEALNIWKRFRLKLQKNLMDMAKNVGYDRESISKIRSLTNFYPPEQLVKDLRSEEEALEFFNKIGIYPNLGEVGKEGAEGLYGKSTKFIRQSFETGPRVQVAQLVVDESGGYKVMYKSTAEAEHIIEGQAQKNLAGYVQAAEHAMEETKKALSNNHYDIVEKQLKRISDALKEARNLVNASTESELLEKISSLENSLKNIKSKAFRESGIDAGELIKKIDDIEKKLKPIEAELVVETSALKSLNDAKNPKTRYLLKGLIDNDSKFLELKNKLITLSDDAISKGLTKEMILWFGTTFLDFWNLAQLDDAIKKVK